MILRAIRTIDPTTKAARIIAVLLGIEVAIGLSMLAVAPAFIHWLQYGLAQVCR